MDAWVQVDYIQLVASMRGRIALHRIQIPASYCIVTKVSQKIHCVISKQFNQFVPIIPGGIVHKVDLTSVQTNLLATVHFQLVLL